MNKGKIMLLAGSVLMMAGTASAADEQRHISIRNTDSVWLPGNICSLQFRLDNGGSGQGFHHLSVTLQLKDPQGNVLEQGVMKVEPFGDSDATRSQNAFLETECRDNVSSIGIVRASEEINGKKTDLPLTIFDPQYYRPLPLAISTDK
jgi:hypothetical protein